MRFSDSRRAIEERLGYTFRDDSLLQQAFTRTSFCNEHADEGYQSSEVLEFFGDSVLSLVLVSIFIRDFSVRYEHGVRTRFNEGDLSVIKSNLSDKRNLSRSMRELDLSRFLLMGEGDKKEGVMREASVMEDLYESILGAIYIDSGRDLDVMIGVVERTLDTSIFLERRAPVQNFKGQLQEYCQDRSRRLGVPVYQTRSKEGPDDNPMHERVCIVNGEVLGVGRARGTKEADNLAAEAALASLKARGDMPKNKAQRPDTTDAYRLHLLAMRMSGVGLIDGGAKEHPASTSTAPRFTYTYTLGDLTVSADGVSKNEAKQRAAAEMLKKLNEK